MEFLTLLMSFDPMAYYVTATTAISGAAMLASVTPTKRDDRFIGKVAKAVDLIGFNFGFARNQSLEQEVKKTTTAGQKRRLARIDAKKGK